MKIWYCDRCKKKINFENHGTIRTKEYSHARIFHWYVKEHNVDEKEVELCNDCMESYFRWFMDPNEFNEKIENSRV